VAHIKYLLLGLVNNSVDALFTKLRFSSFRQSWPWPNLGNLFRLFGLLAPKDFSF